MHMSRRHLLQIYQSVLNVHYFKNLRYFTLKKNAYSVIMKVLTVFSSKDFYPLWIFLVFHNCHPEFLDLSICFRNRSKEHPWTNSDRQAVCHWCKSLYNYTVSLYIFFAQIFWGHRWDQRISHFSFVWKEQSYYQLHKFILFQASASMLGKWENFLVRWFLWM